MALPTTRPQAIRTPPPPRCPRPVPRRDLPPILPTAPRPRRLRIPPAPEPGRGTPRRSFGDIGSGRAAVVESSTTTRPLRGFSSVVERGAPGLELARGLTEPIIA